MEVNLDIVPATLETAITLVCKGLSPEDTRKIRAGEFTTLIEKLGEQLVGEWTLFDETTPMRNFCRVKFELNYPLDVTKLILNGAISTVLNEPRIDDAIIRECHSYWMQKIGKVMPDYVAQ